jgi:uncharacterized protein YgiM (DUF1202 family)
VEKIKNDAEKLIMVYQRSSKFKFSSLLLSSVSVFALSACQTTRSIDTSDACYQYVQPLHNTQSIVEDSTVGGAVAGAVVGGILGLIIGGDAKSAGIGAAAGAGAGAVAGNQYGKAQSAEQRVKLVGELNQMASTQSQAVGQAVGTISSLTNCRRQEVTKIQQLASSGEISKDEARRQLGLVKNKVASDNRLISALVGDAQTRVNEYVKVGTEKGLEKETLVGANDYSTWTPPPATVTNSPSGETLVVKTGSRVRSAPSTSASVLGSLAPGDTITASGSTSDGSWTRFTFEGKEAYVFSELVEPGTQAAPVTQAATSPADWSMPAPENEVQELAQNTAKAKAAKQEHQELSKDIDQLFAALDA